MGLGARAATGVGTCTAGCRFVLRKYTAEMRCGQRLNRLCTWGRTCLAAVASGSSPVAHTSAMVRGAMLACLPAPGWPCTSSQQPLLIHWGATHCIAAIILAYHILCTARSHYLYTHALPAHHTHARPQLPLPHTQGEPLPPISRFQAAAIGPLIYIHTHRNLEDILVLDTSTSPPTLRSAPVKGPAPPSRGLHSMVAVEGGKALLVYGGAPQQGLMVGTGVSAQGRGGAGVGASAWQCKGNAEAWGCVLQDKRTICPPPQPTPMPPAMLCSWKTCGA